MSEIEAELVKLLKFKKAPEDYEDRQEYLDAITQTVDKIKDDAVFDAMTEPAYDWLQEAVEAHNKKQEIPEFPDAEPEEEEAVDEGVEEEPEADSEVDEEAAEETVEEEIPEETIEEEVEETTEGEGVEKETGSDDSNSVSEEPVPEAEPVPAEQPVKKPRKPRKGHGGRYLKKKKGKPDVQPKNKPGHEPNYKKITGKKNRYGITEGTKRDLALKMLEKGCTMRDVNIELGDNYYVLLRRMSKEGHLVEKLKNGVIKITHKDDRVKKAK